MSGAGARRPDRTGRTTGQSKGHKPLVKLPSGQFLQLPRELVESPAFRALSPSALRALFRLCVEHMAHGGAENGKLIVTHRDFVAYGIGHNSVKPALLELEALGFVEVTRQGGKAVGDMRMTNLFRLTFPQSRNSPETHEWFSIKSIEEARQRIADHRKDYEERRPPRKEETQSQTEPRRAAG